MINNRFYQKNIPHIKLQEIIKLIDGKLHPVSNKINNINITGVNTISEASQNELCFLTNQKYISDLKTSNTQFCLIEDQLLNNAKKYNQNISYISSKHAYSDLGIILNYFYNILNNKKTISSSSVISDTANIKNNCKISDGVVIDDNVSIGNNCTILANSYIGQGVKIGNNTTIGANSVITYATIGNNVEIMNNVSIGQDGFGFAFDGKNFQKIIQLGTVIIHDNVSIGAGTAIDRGSMEDTIIGEDTKIDNLVQIGHNVKIGKHCLIAGQAGIAGSTEIEDFVVIGGQEIGRAHV